MTLPRLGWSSSALCPSNGKRAVSYHPRYHFFLSLHLGVHNTFEHGVAPQRSHYLLNLQEFRFLNHFKIQCSRSAYMLLHYVLFPLLVNALQLFFITWVRALTRFSLGNKGGSSPTWKSKYTVLCVKVENSLLKQNLYVPFLEAVKVKLSYCFFISLYNTWPSGSSSRQSTS